MSNIIFFWNILRFLKIVFIEINLKILLNYCEIIVLGYCVFYLRGKKYKLKIKLVFWCLNWIWIGFVIEVKCD